MHVCKSDKGQAKSIVGFNWSFQPNQDDLLVVILHSICAIDGRGSFSALTGRPLDSTTGYRFERGEYFVRQVLQAVTSKT